MTRLILIVFLSFSASCSSSTKANSGKAGFSSDSTIEVMAWNVENLFDTTHDEGKDDWTFLPAKTPGKNDACAKVSYKRYRDECFETDWNDEKLKIKLEKIKEVLTRDRENLPDILALSEIENENVISKLAVHIGYKSFIVSNSPDKRGIDLALLWNEKKLKLVSQTEHEIESKALRGATRNILEANLLIAGKHSLTIFVNHWPSQGNKNESRMQAARIMMKRFEDLQKKQPQMLFMALGDFNVIDSNRPDPFFEVVEKRGLTDVHNLFMNEKSIEYKVKMSYPLGTYFYGKSMQWNRLDRIFVSKNLHDKKGVDLVLSSYQIYAPKFMTDTYEYKKYKSDNHYGSSIIGVPKSYNHNTARASKAGYSDHFPVIVKLKY